MSLFFGDKLIIHFLKIRKKLDKMKYASNNIYFSKRMLLFSIN